MKQETRSRKHERRNTNCFLPRASCLIFLASCLLLLISFFSAVSAVNTQDTYPQIGKIETVLFGRTFSDLKISERLTRIENNVFSKSYPLESLDKRTQRVKEVVLGQSINNEVETSNEKSKTTIQTTSSNGFQAQEVSAVQFLELLFTYVNESRSFKGLLPLTKDDIATKVAAEHANSILTKGYLSNYDLDGKGTDERYTLSGGTGAITEIIKGFDLDKTEKSKEKIKLTELLAKQLVEAISVSQDDSRVLFSPYLTHIGCGSMRSQDGKKFVSVIEFLTKGGEFEPLKTAVNLGEKLTVGGKVNHPFKFKAVSVAYFDESVQGNINDEDGDYSFDEDSLKPYFPPQDYIAFSDMAKSNFIKVIKGLGFIGAIAGAPFTGGATAVLAPAILSSIQSGPPKEIPLKRGIKSNSKGGFSGQIDLNYQGMNGLYFISVLAELPSIDYPIVISRRTVKVNPLLPSLSKTSE